MLIKNFLWVLQHYVNASTLLEVEKVFFTSLYLTRHVKTW